MDLGKKLYELRKSKNLSQEDVATKLNVSRQTISKWETNQSTPDFDRIVPLCDLFEISTDELLKDEQKQENVTDEEWVEQCLEEEKKHLSSKKKIDYSAMTKNEINQKSAEIISSSILIFVIAVAYAGIGIAALKWNPIVVGCTFLVLIGWGVTRIVKHYMSIPEFEKTAEEKRQDKIIKQINDIIGVFGVAIYFLLSFLTMAWHITWIIFIIIGIIEEIIKLLFMLKGEDEDEESE